MEKNEENIAAELTEAAGENRDDLDDLPVKDEEQLFFDNTDFQDYEDDENYHGGFLSVAAFVLSIASIMFVTAGTFWLVIGGSALALILGIIAVAGKHGEMGFAVAGIIISVFVIITCSWAYIDYPYFWGKKAAKDQKQFSIHDDEDNEPGVLASISVHGMNFICNGGVD